MKYSLIYPVYNEQDNLPQLFQRTQKVLKQLKGTYEIIFVNDGSSDNTLKILQQIHQNNPQIKVINFSRNFGHQTAVTAGLDYSSGLYIAVLDADLQDPPEVLPQFFQKLNQGYDVVYAIRTHRKESLIMRTLYSSFYRLLKRVANIDIPLDSGDFCVMNKQVVDTIKNLPERNRFIRGLRSWVGFKQIGIPYDRAARYAGPTKYTFKKLIKLAIDGLFSFSYLPLRILTLLGLIIFILSLIGSLVAIYLRLFTDQYSQVPGFATTIILIMFMGGLNMFSIGLVGEYIARIYDEVKQRPNYIISSTIGFKNNHHQP